MHPTQEAIAPERRHPDGLGTAVGLDPDPEEPIAIADELAERDRQRLEGSSDDPY